MEVVWVVRRRDLFPRETPHGFVGIESDAFEDDWLEICRDRGFYVERREAEASPEWKQIIPYCVVDTPEGIVCVERLPRGSEKRLAGKLSIGIGGHIDACDRTPEGELLSTAAERELREELDVSSLDRALDFEALGLINDDTSPVGSVHVGVAYRTQLEFVPEVRETDRLRATPTPLVKLRGMCHAQPAFESWSQFLLDSPDWSS